jgi:hypothetical protein
MFFLTAKTESRSIATAQDMKVVRGQKGDELVGMNKES